MERLFPCDHNKEPLNRNGCSGATSNKDRQEEWAIEHEGCLWGLATGNGLFVLDVDIKPNPDGELAGGDISYQRMVDGCGPLPRTKTVQTASGGWHEYYSYDPGKHNIRNSVNKPGKGLDIRGDGGYVIRENGDSYTVKVDAPIAPAPNWLIYLVEKRERQKTDYVQHPSEIQFNNNHSIESIITEHGYKKVNEFGGVARFLPPNSSTGSAGVRIYSDTNTLYSDNGSCQLADGLHHDAFDCLRILEYGSSRSEALAAIGADELDFKLFRTDDLLKEDIPELYWVIPNILPAGTTLLSGKPKRGKSFLALMMSLCVSAGKTVLGQDTAKNQSAVFLGLEDSKRRLQRRIRGSKASLNIQNHGEHYWHTDIPNMNDDMLIKWLDGIMTEYPRMNMIVIDMLKNIKGDSPGKDIYKEDGKVGDALTKFCHSHPELAVVVVHHNNKIDNEDPLDSISGSTGLIGSFDNLAVLADNGEERVLHLTGRDVERQEINLEVEKGTYTLKVPTDPLEKSMLEIDERCIDIINGFDGEYSQNKTVDALMSRFKYKRQESLDAFKRVTGG